MGCCTCRSIGNVGRKRFQMLPEQQCKLCKHKWNPRGDKPPKFCPGCRRPNWQGAAAAVAAKPSQQAATPAVDDQKKCPNCTAAVKGRYCVECGLDTTTGKF